MSGKLSILSLLCCFIRTFLHSHLCRFLPGNIVPHILRTFNLEIIESGWSQHWFYTKCSMFPLLHPSLTTFTIRILFELLYPHGGRVSCSSSPGQMPGPTGLGSCLAGAVQRGSGCKWRLTVYSVLWTETWRGSRPESRPRNDNHTNVVLVVLLYSATLAYLSFSIHCLTPLMLKAHWLSSYIHTYVLITDWLSCHKHF